MIAMRGLSLASDWPGAPQEYAQLRAMLQPLLSRLKAYEDGQQDAELSFRQEVPRSRDDFTRTLSGQAVGDFRGGEQSGVQTLVLTCCLSCIAACVR